MYFSCLCLCGLCACVLLVYGVIKNNKNNTRIIIHTRAYSKEFFGVHNFKSSCMM